jgi:hypothetical protein
MTPKEKANELFDKYCFAIRTEERGSGYFTNIIYAKDCALIAVDELIKGVESDWSFMEKRQEYWKEVKQEIVNL